MKIYGTSLVCLLLIGMASPWNVESAKASAPYMNKVVQQSSHITGTMTDGTDPYSQAQTIERIVAPGSNGTLVGQNLDKVKSLVVGGQSVNNVSMNDDGSLSYIVSKSLGNGTHRVVLLDKAGHQYGANTIEVSNKCLVSAGLRRPRDFAITNSGDHDILKHKTMIYNNYLNILQYENQK